MQISSKQISIAKQQQLADRLVMLFSDLREPSTVQAFIEAFFSETEQAVFQKRLAILWQLQSGKSYQEIKKSLKVSSATISSTSDLLENPAIKDALQKIKADQKTAQFLNRFGL